MSLRDSLIALPPNKWKYYYDTPDIDFCAFDHISAYGFIKGTYNIGSKDKIFDVGFKESFKAHGKHEHTVVLYFLGCMFEQLLSTDLKNHLAPFIANVDTWFDFRYTWFLTSLYHDTASVLEQIDWKRGCSSDIDFYLGKYDVLYNLYEHKWSNPTIKPYIYSEMLVRNYFKYRTEYCHKIDHGIIAGFILYDRLVKNYNDAWAKYSKTDSYGSYDDFYYKGLHWSKDHMPHFAIIADSIIAHNMWRSGNSDVEKSVYRDYGLDQLIFNKANRISICNNPLVFFLGLFDTIEPFKRFNTLDCLNEVDIYLDSKGNIEIFVHDPLKYGKWFDGIADMSDWLSVEVVRLSDNVINISIIKQDEEMEKIEHYA